MNYYIQGDAAKAKQIKAAFEKLGTIVPIRRSCADDGLIYFLLDGEVFSITIKAIELFKKNPDYKELELPVEPKFNVGDWVVFNNSHNSIYQISEIRDSFYTLTHTLGGSMPLSFSQEYLIRPWTIEDAKEGDVLLDEDTGTIGIFEKIYGIHWYSKIYCGNSTCATVYVNGGAHEMRTKPATKEQRDLLFATIKKIDYEWDEEKKELRKIKPHYDIANFHAGMPVLVRIDNSHKWSYTLFSHYNEGFNYPFSVASCCSIKQCIPYNNDTKHLLGTTDMCPEEYINW